MSVHPSAEDQAAFLQDRINCLNSLSDSTPACNEVLIVNKLCFFVSDHPAKQFERGTQLGGKYKCGGCSMHESMMDLAHTLQLPRRNLQEIQQITTQGNWGKRPGELKPFDQLQVLMHVKAWARPNARVRKYTEKIEYYTEVWLYYTEAWLWLTWQSIKKRVASEFRNVVS